jgi:two-component system sensor histidine kinase PilS (NtrC family)
LCRGDGVGFPVLVSAARIRHAGGPAVLAVVRDLSERDRAERALRRAEDLRRRGEQLAYVGELAARLNHEIKNPLATVRAGLEVLDRELELGEDHAQVLDTVIQEIRNVNRLVSSLLGVARPERMEPATHDLVELAREALDPFRPVARRKGIDMVLTGPSEALPVVVDDRAFHRLLGNLLMNALDVLGNRGRIEVICRVAPAAEVERHLPGCRGSVAAVAVIDDGPGIPPAVFEQLFDPFFTTKSSGTGLGLPVARDIVEAHGGALVVRSRPGEGAAFEAFLPGPGSAPRGCGFDAGAPDVED